MNSSDFELYDNFSDAMVAQKFTLGLSQQQFNKKG